MVNLEQVAQNKAFGGSITKYKFVSDALAGSKRILICSFPRVRVRLPRCESLYNSPSFDEESYHMRCEFQVPVVTYLAGLTCNEDTAPWKAGLLLPASQHSLALLFPDTSPRGAQIPTEDDSWTLEPAPGLSQCDGRCVRVLKDNEQVGGVLDLERQSVMGHSMGGHGAITLYLKGVLEEREGVVYRAASGFAPILNPTKCPWGDKAFKGYLKGELEEGKAHDATELIAKAKGKNVQILADYVRHTRPRGTADNFYNSGQLLPENFVAAAKQAGFGDNTLLLFFVFGRRGRLLSRVYYPGVNICSKHVTWHALLLKK
ncbi:Serine hydrolase involved in the detoxification of formaldehyde [Rhizoctonia solani]|uniref:S-formylglutathione hydrolase n=1 Tax=Rhizoctonia solani TaxID=456999 RepID=A0A8H7M262_9AGAM|nr:Serine hydrolase involved in the detoxification of formaldehyde [Rhizoctonia solani]